MSWRTDGARSCRALAEIRFVVAGHQLTQQAEGAPVLLASRPLLEAHLRRRVLALPNVAMRERCAAVGLHPSDGGDRVNGVMVRGRGAEADEQLPADLVIVASGRSSQLPAWLAELGYPRPAEDRLHVDLRYVSRRLLLPGPPPGGDKLIGIGARPGLPRGLMLIAQEDHWMLTVSGYGVAHHPPTEEQAFGEFVASVAPADVLAAIQESTPLGELVSHRFPANQRRRYERLRRFPAGLLAAGDALASFNPLYGQGMSVAAMEAVQLRGCLQVGERQLAQRFFRAAAKVVDQAWGMAVGGDLFLPEVEGVRSLGMRLTNAYLRRLLIAAEHDPTVAAVYNQVGDLLVSADKVLQPAVLRRVLRPSAPTTAQALRRLSRSPSNPSADSQIRLTSAGLSHPPFGWFRVAHHRRECQTATNSQAKRLPRRPGPTNRVGRDRPAGKRRDPTERRVRNWRAPPSASRDRHRPARRAPAASRAVRRAPAASGP